MANVARIVEISATSDTSFDDAVQQGINSVGQDQLQFVVSGWVKEQRVTVDAGRITGYQVNLLVTVMSPEGKPAIW
jgi:flavin-binding protein dodecin